MAISVEDSRKLEDAIKAITTCAQMLQDDGYGRLFVGGALLHVLNRVIECGSTPEDVQALRALYVQGLQTGNC